MLAWSLAAAPVRADVVDYQQWAAINAEAHLDDVAQGLRLFFNAESRALNTPRYPAYVTESGREEQNPNTVLLIRPAVGYQLRPWLTVWLGYAWQPIFFRGDLREDVHEHRVFQQASGSWTWDRWQLGYRTRLEQRYRTTGDNPHFRQGEGEWAHRARQQLRVAWTVAAGAPLQLIAFDEVFVHLNDTAYPSRQGLDQNRLFAGFGYQASPELRLELGYLNQFVRRFTDPHQLNHVLWFNIAVRWQQAAAPHGE